MAKGQKTRDRIKEEALNLFSTLGFAGGSVRDIGKEAGVRESALYNYFSSKEAIMSELIQDAKDNSVGLELLTDELLEYLSKPKIFIEKFVDVLFVHWNKDEQKKYLRLILIEQFRSDSSAGVSVNILIEETIKIWGIIFSQMLNYKFIKRGDSRILAEEFVYPLFMMRLQYLSNNKVDWKILKQKSESHINYFWNSIKK
ncbi:MAG: TetR/AcrR family transcriptional regulator [Melioribacteraceae bacterium]|jgi:AcrR family transcriptional regulator|nr:TetR/AcrR family transcriptional regulator [Melioribacteraceae bacterium]